MIDQIQKVTDKKGKVILEDGSSFVLYMGEIRRYHLHEGSEVPEAVLEEILGKVLVKRARLGCMNLLKTSDRTVRQLQDRLKRDGYPQQIIDNSLQYVAFFHYTDDERYAENYIRFRIGKKSRKIITLELEKKGVSSGLIEEAFSVISEEQAENGQKEGADIAAIRKLVEKKHYDPQNASWEDRRKLIGYL
ncbi:MAG TPA: RecX family transcriptional regulator, partial [Lachnospiraceae bacterium]|nr:RecX family transcriptional regulator [Lachnospiraceae bacterium]